MAFTGMPVKWGETDTYMTSMPILYAKSDTGTNVMGRQSHDDIVLPLKSKLNVSVFSKHGFTFYLTSYGPVCLGAD